MDSALGSVLLGQSDPLAAAAIRKMNALSIFRQLATFRPVGFLGQNSKRIGSIRRHNSSEISQIVPSGLRRGFRRTMAQSPVVVPGSGHCSLQAPSCKRCSAGSASHDDGAKRITGRKRHILVDSLGLLLAVVVTSAAVDDAAAAPAVLGQLMQESFPRFETVWADTKYHNHALNRWVSEHGWYVIRVVSRPPGEKGFKLLPGRWVVERTYAWLGRCRVHSRDYEHLTESSEVQIQISMIQLTLRRLTGAKHRDPFRYKRPERKKAA